MDIKEGDFVFIKHSFGMGDEQTIEPFQIRNIRGKNGEHDKNITLESDTINRVIHLSKDEIIEKIKPKADPMQTCHKFATAVPFVGRVKYYPSNLMHTVVVLGTTPDKRYDHVEDDYMVKNYRIKTFNPSGGGLKTTTARSLFHFEFINPITLKDVPVEEDYFKQERKKELEQKLLN